MSSAKAVIAIGKSQYLVGPGEQILVDRLPQESGDFPVTDVLLAIDGDKISVGQPRLSNVKVSAKIVGHLQGEKIRVEKYKAKSRYHKVRGSRSKLTRLQIDQIDIREK